MLNPYLMLQTTTVFHESPSLWVTLLTTTYSCWQQDRQRGRGNPATSSWPGLVDLTHRAPDGRITSITGRCDILPRLFIEDNGGRIPKESRTPSVTLFFFFVVDIISKWKYKLVIFIMLLKKKNTHNNCAETEGQRHTGRLVFF